MESKIMSILCEICGAEEGELDENLDLFEAGLIDSFAVVEMLVKFEEQLGISLDIEKLSREQIATPALIIKMAEGAA